MVQVVERIRVRIVQARHATAELKHEVKGVVILDAVRVDVGLVLEQLAGEYEALVVGRDVRLVLDLLLDVVDGVGGLHPDDDGLAREGLHEDLHARVSLAALVGL